MRVGLDAPPARLDVERLAVPGVIGMRDPAELSFSCVPHVLIGPDAGFPWCQPLDEWKGDVALVDARALSSVARAAAGIRLPEERLAEREELDRWAVDAGAAPRFDEDRLSALRVAGRAFEVGWGGRAGIAAPRPLGGRSPLTPPPPSAPRPAPSATAAA